MKYHLVLTAACALVGCGGNASDSKKSLLPIAVGNEWVYEQTGGVAPSTVTKRVAATEIYDDQETFVWETRDTANTELKRHNIRVTKDGVTRVRQQRFDATGSLISERLYDPGFLRVANSLDTAGASVSESHIRTEYIGGQLTREDLKRYTWIVEDPDAEVSVPGGVFRCAMIRRTNDDTGEYTQYCYTPGIGKIIEVGEIEIEALSSFHLE